MTDAKSSDSLEVTATWMCWADAVVTRRTHMCQPTIRKRRRLAKIVAKVVDAAESGDSDDRTDF